MAMANEAQAATLLGSSPSRLSEGIVEKVVLVCTAVALQMIVWAAMAWAFWIHHFGYVFDQMSDTMIYVKYADAMSLGMWPYAHLAVEYPPLALPLFLLPPHSGTFARYEVWFSLEMIAISAATAAITTVAAMLLWRDQRRTLLTILGFTAAVVACGPLIANRYDIAVAAVIALWVTFLVRRHYAASAAALGIGFALKLTPAMLLPLVFLIGGRRTVVRSLAAFVIAAALPFAPFALQGFRGVSYIVTYHAQRPLQIESVFATPYLVAHMFGLTNLTTTSVYGSQNIVASGTSWLASLSVWAIGASLFVAYWVLWRRHVLRADPSHAPLVALTLVLTLMCFSKVLSPQFLIWTLPLVALVLANGRRGERTVGILLVASLVLTQVEFPALYWSFVDLHRGPVVLVAFRNGVLVVATALAWRAVVRLPARPLGLPMPEVLSRVAGRQAAAPSSK